MGPGEVLMASPRRSLSTLCALRDQLSRPRRSSSVTRRGRVSLAALHATEATDCRVCGVLELLTSQFEVLLDCVLAMPDAVVVERVDAWRAFERLALLGTLPHERSALLIVAGTRWTQRRRSTKVRPCGSHTDVEIHFADATTHLRAQDGTRPALMGTGVRLWQNLLREYVSRRERLPGRGGWARPKRAQTLGVC